MLNLSKIMVRRNLVRNLALMGVLLPTLLIAACSPPPPPPPPPTQPAPPPPPPPVRPARG